MICKAEDILNLWEGRYRMAGGLATGPHSRSAATQDEDYRVRREWLSERIGPAIRSLPVLDYGCGTGRYVPMWKGKYVGVDVSPSLCGQAKKDHPGSDFILLEQPWLPAAMHLPFPPSVFYTATVLQHCADEVNSRVFGSLRVLDLPLTKMVIYENSSTIARISGKEFPTPEVCSDSKKLCELVARNGWEIEDVEEWEHIFLRDPHRLVILHLAERSAHDRDHRPKP